MTQNQKRLLQFIARYRERYLDSPTLREMVAGVGVFDNRSVLGILESLEKSGYVTKRGGRRSRGIRLTQKAHELLGLVPAVGPGEVPDIFNRLRRSAPGFVSFTESPVDKTPFAANGTTMTSNTEALYQAALVLNRLWNGSAVEDADHSRRWWSQPLVVLRNKRLGWITASSFLTLVAVSRLVGSGLAGAAWFVLVFFSIVLAMKFTRDTL